MPRGGRRAGAGAPKGNLNALKQGRHSPRILLLVLALMKLPLFRQYLLRQLSKEQNALKRRERKRQLEALAHSIIAQVIKPGVLHNEKQSNRTASRDSK